MAYTVTTTNSYGSRVGNSFKNIGSGFLMFIIGTCLLWWNEGRTVKTEDMLNEAQANTEIVDNVSKLNPELEGKLIHATALATTTDSISDPDYPVGGIAIAVKRDVEYYQWVEHQKEERRDKLGGGEEVVTTYTYSKEWVSSPVNSSSFADPDYQGKNTVRKNVDANEVYAENVTFGAYTFPKFFIQSIGGEKPAMVQVEGNSDNVHESLAVEEPADSTVKEGEEPALAEGEQPAAKEPAQPREQEAVAKTIQHGDYVVDGNMVYYGNPNNVTIGDVRVTFTRIDPATVSILGKVKGDTFVKYVAKNGKDFSRLEMGTVSAEEMYQGAHDENDMIKWALRLLGVLLVIGGLKGIFGILTTLLKVVPFLASIMNFGVSLICIVVGLAWSLIVIGLAWLFYRPLLGITLLVLAGALIAFFVMRGRNRPAPQPEPAPIPNGPQGQQFPQQPQYPQQPQQQFPQQPQQLQQFQQRPQQFPQQPQQPQQFQQRPQQFPQQPQYPQQQPQQPQQFQQRPQQFPQQPQYPQQPQQFPQQPEQTQQQAPQQPQEPQQ